MFPSTKIGRALAPLLALLAAAAAAQEPPAVASAPPPQTAPAPIAPTTATPAPAAPTSAAPPAPAVPAARAAQQCELHIWPTERFRSHTSGMGSLMGGLIPALIDAAINRPRDRDNRELMRSILDSADQAGALVAIDPQIQLILPRYRLVPHETPPEWPQGQDRPRTRHAASSAPCYAELIVTRLFYTHQISTGGQLQSSFLFRDFGNGSAVPLWTRDGGGIFPLRRFPPRGETETEAADTELRTMFQAGFEQFARDLVFARRRQRRGR